jgi:iron complex outermembrane receptor protein
MTKLSLTKHPIRLGLLAASAGLLAVSAIQAQTAPTTQSETVKLETMEVTGSRLSSAAVEGALPVVSYNAFEIAATGATTLVDYLKTLPFSGGTGTIGSNFTNGGNGTTSIALRGIGGENTLVLLNGRRMTPSGTGAAVDLNAIPFSAIERIEILKSGGSVVYGTDAVAGVINVILKKDATGGSASLYYGNTTETDASKRAGSFSVAGMSDKLQFLVGASWEKENGMYAPDRDYAVGGGHSGYGNPGRFFFYGAMQNALLAANGLTSAGSWTLDAGVNVPTRLADFKPWVNTAPSAGGDRFPYENFTTMVNPNERYNVFANFEYDLFGERMKFFGDINYADTHSEFMLAASPFSSAIPIPAQNYWVQQLLPGAVDDIDLSYRFADFAPRLNVVDRTVFRIISGLRGKLTDSINYETSYNYSEETTADQELNGISEPRLLANNATNTSGDYNYFTRSYNPRDGSVPAGAPFNSAALINLLRTDSATAVSSRTQVIDFKATDSELFTLPAGPIEAVVGLEGRTQNVLSKPDDAKLSGSIGWNAADGITRGSRHVMGGYAEVGIPILASLSGTVAYRYEKYENEFNAKVGGAGLRWRALKDELTVRANYSQGFVAPALLDLFNPGFESFPEIIDPRFPVSDPLRIYQISTQYVGSVAGGAALKPEESDISSVGFTYSPKALQGFSATVDWAKIKQENIIVYSVQGVVSEWARTGGPTNPNAAFRDRVVLRNDPTAPNGMVIDALLGVGPRNVALRNTEYVDIAMTYDLPTKALGRFAFSADATRYLDQTSTSEIGGTEYSYLGVFDGDVCYPKWKGRLMTRWDMKDYSVALTGNYMGSVVDDTGARDNLEQDWTVDLQLGYKLPIGSSRFGSTLTIGARNLFDNPPPTSAGAFSNNYPERSYDARGRFLYVKLEQSF